MSGGAPVEGLVPQLWSLSVLGARLEADCAPRTVVAAPAALALFDVEVAFLLLTVHLDAQATSPLLSLWAAARCHMEQNATCFAAAVAAPYVVQSSQDGAAGVHPSGVASQAAVPRAATAEVAAAAVGAAAHPVQYAQDAAAGRPPSDSASSAAAPQGSRSVLPAAEGGAVLAAAEETAVLPEGAAAVPATAEEAAVVLGQSAGYCFGGACQTCQQQHTHQAGTCQTHAASHPAPSLCHQHRAADLYLGVH